MTPTPTNERIEKLAAEIGNGVRWVDAEFKSFKETDGRIAALLTAFEADVRADAQAAAYMAGGEVVRKYKDEVADLRAQLAAVTTRRDFFKRLSEEKQTAWEKTLDELAATAKGRDELSRGLSESEDELRRYRAAYDAACADRDRYRAQLAAMTERSDAWMTVTGKFDISKQPENKSCLQYVCDEIADLRAQLATLQGQTRWECKCGGMDVKGQAENEAMKAQLAAMTSELTRLKEYAFGMESALRGARASGTASELSMAKAEAAEQRLLRQEIDMEFTRLRADRDRYREACGAMEADKKRLDWLEDTGYMLDYLAHAVDKPHPDDHWICTDGDNSGEGDTLRAAIDAAMQQHPTSDTLTPKTTDKASDVTQQEAKP